MRNVIPHICAAILVFMTGCGAGEAELASLSDEGPRPDAGRPSDTGNSYPDTLRFDDTTTAATCEVATPGVDTDGDGIQDVVEDRNLNCVVDPGETDPLNPDTDGDGLFDGEEDLDRNGQWDQERGEFDATVADTDGDGTVDGDEPGALLCVASVAGRSIRSTAMLADGRLVLVPAEWSVSTNPENDILWVQSDNAAVAYLAGAAAELWGSSALQLLTQMDRTYPGVRTHQLIASHGDTHWSQYRLQSGELDGYELVAELLNLDLLELPDSDEPPEDDEGSAQREADSNVFIEVAVDASASRATIAVYESGERPPTLDWLASPQRIAPRAGLALRAHCVEQEPAFEGLPITVVVGDVRTSNEEAVRAILGTLWSELQSKGLLEDGFFAPADVHVTASLSSWISSMASYSFDEVLRLLLEIDNVSEDQRVWSNALALVGAVRSAAESTEQDVTLVVVAGSEDTSYREGTYDGRDGDPEQQAIPAGPERDALDAYYVAELQRAGVRLVAVGPDAPHGEGCLSALRPDAPSSMDDSSYQRLARSTGGVWLDGCQLPDARQLAHFLRNRIPTAYLPAPGSNLAGILEVPGSDSLIQPAQSGLTSYAMSGTSPSEIPLVRLVWEE